MRKTITDFAEMKKYQSEVVSTYLNDTKEGVRIWTTEDLNGKTTVMVDTFVNNRLETQDQYTGLDAKPFIKKYE